ncbi:adenine phosphoribosyltransferase [Actinokineospora sp. NBRC 105648]|uniref:adenine phosphoribosyltransferase n=1 Tax=Actinokineospora sp. NBRC 105648 TaxID=3032206 RepID=UPI0024A5A8B3|nr:adenine phosphoribosyltransferase [Actinokineospora sp. NBRC 105648]GLZ43022.1 adenine phosphoribosyltransferase [Actinokineospora sp. NBRC 105648]
MASTLEDALALVRDVPDFPVPGVLFRDLSPLLADRDGFRAVVDALAAFVPDGVGTLVAVEARGFLFGAAMAAVHGYGLVPVRKPGKLPAVADRVTYELEYGTATLELPEGVLGPGDRVVVVDDVLATGGTAAAATGLAERAGAEVVGVVVVVEIPALAGRARLRPHTVHALIAD